MSLCRPRRHPCPSTSRSQAATPLENCRWLLPGPLPSCCWRHHRRAWGRTCLRAGRLPKHPRCLRLDSKRLPSAATAATALTARRSGSACTAVPRGPGWARAPRASPRLRLSNPHPHLRSKLFAFITLPGRLLHTSFRLFVPLKTALNINNSRHLPSVKNKMDPFEKRLKALESGSPVWLASRCRNSVALNSAGCYQCRSSSWILVWSVSNLVF